MADVDLRRLRYFVAVAEERHFGRAAARLHMSTPPLSQRIRELEAELDVLLFERSSRHVDITPAGERLVVEARAVLDAFARFHQVAAALTAADTDLGFGFCHGSEGGAMEAIRRLRDERPEVVVHPATMTSVNIVDALATGRLSVGIVRGSVDDTERVASVPLARVPVDHIALPSGHRLAARDRVFARDLDGEAVLVVDRSDAPHTHDEVVSFFDGLGVRPNFVTHGATQIERVFDMVAIGSGVGWLNRWQAEREPRRDDMVVRSFEPSGMWDEFRVAWRHGDTRPDTAACVRVVVETCGG